VRIGAVVDPIDRLGGPERIAEVDDLDGRVRAHPGEELGPFIEGNMNDLRRRWPVLRSRHRDVTCQYRALEPQAQRHDEPPNEVVVFWVPGSRAGTGGDEGVLR
jgi:hypothetical protein